jgi:hypothetical protein
MISLSFITVYERLWFELVKLFKTAFPNRCYKTVNCVLA